MRTTTQRLQAMALLLTASFCTSCVTPDDNAHKSDDSSVIILSPGRERLVATDDEVGRVSARIPASDSSVFGGFSGNSILFWMQETANTNRGASAKNEVQIIALEPVGDLADSIMIPEKPAWYEWVNPCLFLPKWVDFWMTETNATPVVLVLLAF